MRIALVPGKLYDTLSAAPPDEKGHVLAFVIRAYCVGSYPGQHVSFTGNTGCALAYGTPGKAEKVTFMPSLGTRP